MTYARTRRIVSIVNGMSCCMLHYNYVFARYVIANDIQVHVELNANELKINIVRARFLKRPLNAALKGRLSGA